MTRKRCGRLLFLTAALLLPAAFAWAAQKVEEKDRDGDGRRESKVYSENGKTVRIVADVDGDGKADLWEDYEPGGAVKTIARDRARHDGKPDYWVYLSSGRIYRRDYDRNFDGKPDLKSFEDNHRFLRKEYDDNFDGKFERTVKSPQRGETGIARTSAPK
ncbi:MAG TPA: hypothetical protein VL404_00100 [Candidatus Eisenbacteria bacterium]|jgi:hypothetical protein|nr:hypothetical protein [Candidatus Eisenbacteria bacterium]